MSTSYDFNLAPRRKLTTYGKNRRKHTPGSGIGNATESKFPREPHVSNSSKTVAQKARRSHSSQPGRLFSSELVRPDVGEASGPRENTPSSVASQKSRKPTPLKRKFSRVNTSPAKIYPETSDESSSALESEPVETQASTYERTSKPAANDDQQLQSISAEAMEVDSLSGGLSSPLQNPTQTEILSQSTKRGGDHETPFSPDSMRALDGLLASETSGTEKTRHRVQRLSVRPASQGDRAQAFQATTQPHSIPESPRRSRLLEESQRGAPKRSKKRLIDTLADQQNEQTDSSRHLGRDDSNRTPQPVSSQGSGEIVIETPPSRSAPNKTRKILGAPKTGAFTRSERNLKFTYGQSRTTRADEDLLDVLAVPDEPLPTSNARCLLLKAPKERATPIPALENKSPRPGESPKAKIRDIYELKQAGANSRVAEAMQDLSDQLDSSQPNSSSSRRSALLHIAQSVHEKDFRRQLRDHCLEDKLFESCGAETDVVSGFLMLSTLITLLSTSTTSHLVRLLASARIGDLFGRLIPIFHDITTIARDRKSNLSKRSQMAVLAVQSKVCGLSIWAKRPSHLTVRSLALVCLKLLIGQDAALARESGVTPEEVSSGLFSFVKDIDNPSYWEYPQTIESLDLYSALFVLRFRAVKAVDFPAGGNDLITKNLPVVAGLVATCLSKPTNTSGELEGLVFKLAADVTNDSSEAPDVFITQKVVPVLAEAVCTKFDQVLAPVPEPSGADEPLDELVLRLGILINLSEQSDATRQALYEYRGENVPPIDNFIRLFMEIHRATADADSVEKIQVNVGFAYLAVLLGYLSLYPPIREKFRSCHPAKTMDPLIESLREFIAHLERAMEESEEEANNNSLDQTHGGGAYTESISKLKTLVSQLQMDRLRGSSIAS